MKTLDETSYRLWRDSGSDPSLQSTIWPDLTDKTSILSSITQLILPGNAAMSLKLHNHYNSKVYSTRSHVSGELIIGPPSDVSFSHVFIILVGATKTWADAAQGQQTAAHNFLKLEMPIDESIFPSPRVFKAGSTYKIPFNFVIPDHLTLSVCRHKNVSDDVAPQHLRPPPSMGSWEKDDLSPEMTRVEYSVIAIIYGEPETGSKPTVLMRTTYRINVLPTSVEDPPLNITARDRCYALTKSTNIRKHFLAVKRGRVTAEAAQPAAIRVQADGITSTPDVSVNVKLNFDPTSPTDVPPEVSQVSAKLQATTWFTRVPLGNLPNVGANQTAITGIAHQSYSTSLPLEILESKKSEWDGRKRFPGLLAAFPMSEGRRQSESVAFIRRPDREVAEPQPRRVSEGGLLASQTSAVQLSLRIPTERRILLPTFHTCLASRTYTLHLSLVLGDAKISLAIPVQVVVESPPEHLLAQPNLPTFEDALAAQEEADADELLRPRFTTPPAPRMQDTDGLPRY
ncbi:arrestin [Mariannaea sp. PMI_226]|nr:arrestin [Mariannaea sp. PMI_226]